MLFFRRKNKTRKSRPATQPRRFVRRLPLYLEVLEKRILLSADNWIAGSGNWDMDSNWSLGHAPGTGDTAIINTTSSATITIQSGDSINVQSVTTGSNDALSITGGSLGVTAASEIDGGFTFSGGTIQTDRFVSSNTLTLTGTSNWLGGDFSSGQLVNKGTLTLQGSDDKHLGVAKITNYGVIDQTGSGNLDFESPPSLGTSTLINAQGGVYDLQGDGGMAVIGVVKTISGVILVYSQGVVENAGTFLKSGGTGTNLIDGSGGPPSQHGVIFDNTGTVEAQSGTLEIDRVQQLDSNGVLTGGTWDVSAGATLTLGQGDITSNNADVTLTGAGANFTNFAVTGAFANTGTLKLLSGATVAVPGNFSNSGQLTIDAGSTLTVSGNYAQGGTNQIDPKSTIILNGAGTPANPQFLEVMSQDQGNVTTGFQNQFAFGTLALGNNTYVRLVNDATSSSGSGSEALYVNNLVVPARSSLDLNGLPLYTQTRQVAGTILTTSLSAFNTPVAGTIPTANAVDTWTFLGGASQSVALVVNTGNNGAAGFPVPSTPTLNYAQVQILDPAGNVLASGTNSQTGTDVVLSDVTLPVKGIYRVKVQAAPNQPSSTGNYLITVWNVEPLAVGSTATAAIADGQHLYYRLDVPAGQDVLITGNFNESSQAQIYVRHGALPDTTHFDESSANAAGLNQQASLLQTQPGPYFVLVQGMKGAGSGLAFTLAARDLGFEILGVSPDHATTLSTQFPLTLTGSHFTSTTTVSLSVAGGKPYVATSVQFQNSNTLVATFDLTKLATGVYDVNIEDGGQVFTAPAAFTVANPVPQLLFTSDPAQTTSAGILKSIWSDVLPQPGAGNDTGFPSPFAFSGVQFSLNYTPGEHAILSGDPTGTQSFNVNGTWTLSLAGPVNKTITGSGSSGPVDLSSFNLPGGVYGGQLTLTAPPSGTSYGVSSIYFLSTATDYREQTLPNAHGALSFVGQTANIPVGSTGQVPVRLLSSPIPFTGMVTHFDYDPTGIQVLGFSIPAGWSGGGSGGGGSIGSFSEYSSNGAALHTGDVAFTINVRVLQPGNWLISFEGNAFGLGPTADPSQSLNYLEAMTAAVTVTGTAPAPSSSVTPAGVTVDHTDGTLLVTITGSGLDKAGTAQLVDANGTVVATTQNLSIAANGSVLTAHFPITPPGLYAMSVLDANGNRIAITSGNSLLVAPALPLFGIDRVDTLPQLPGKPVTHIWRVQNTGSVDGVAILSFTFPQYIRDEPSVVLQGLPPGARLLVHGFSSEGWVEYVSVPVAAGAAVDVPWTVTLPPDAAFGQSAPADPGSSISVETSVSGALSATEWQTVSTEAPSAILATAFQDGINDVGSAMDALQARPLDAQATYLDQLTNDSPFPDLGQALLMLGADNTLLPSDTSSLGPDSLPVNQPVPASPCPPAPNLPLANNPPQFSADLDPSASTWSNFWRDVRDSFENGAAADSLAGLLNGTINGGTNALTFGLYTPNVNLGAPFGHADFYSVGNTIGEINGTIQANLLTYVVTAGGGSEIVTRFGGHVSENEFRWYATDLEASGGLLFKDGEQLNVIHGGVGPNGFHPIAIFNGDRLAGNPQKFGAWLHFYTDANADLQATGRFWLPTPRSIQGLLPYLQTAQGVGSINSLLQSYQNQNQALYSGQSPFDPYQSSEPCVESSFDPNDITAKPEGVLGQSWISGHQPLTFTINYSNEASATANAENIRVVAHLDSGLDPATVMAGDSSFPGTEFAFDPSSGTLTWVLPEINLPPDTQPPNGEGFVSFSAIPKANLPTGTQIKESAQVFFDFNPPVATPVVVRTIDVSPPTSQVLPLAPVQSSASFQVQWSGTDQGSGIASYDIYVADNGGPFTIWQSATAQTSATFNGVNGHTYAFYSVATDNVGNVQPTPTAAQASTYVSVPPPPSPPSPPPSPPPAPPTLQVPSLLAFLDSLLGGIETVNANGTETITDSLFGIPLFVSTFNSTGGLVSVTLFGVNITFLFA